MSFTLTTLNLNGIRSADRRGWSRWLKRSAPDLCAVQELRAEPEQVEPELYSPAGWNAHWLCAQKKGYAGVGLFARRQARAQHEGSGLEWGDREGRWLRSDFRELSVVSLYIPSGSSGPERQALKFRYLEHLLPLTQALLDERHPIAICGDFNIAHTEIDIHDPKRNAKNSGFLPEERAWMTRLLAQGWVDVLRAQHPGERGLYSWWSNRGRAREKDLGWRLDYVLATPELAARAEHAWIDTRAGLSDHAPVSVRFRGGYDGSAPGLRVSSAAIGRTAPAPSSSPRSTSSPALRLSSRARESTS